MINPMALEGRTVLVTGASSGIGRETAALLSRLGARLVLAGRDEGRLAETLAMLEGEGHATAPFDLDRTEVIAQWVKDLSRAHGPLGGMVHAAGIRSVVPLKMVDAHDAEQALRTNVATAILLAKGFRQKGVHGNPASIVLISSVAGLAGEAGLAVYSACKGAILALTKSLALELARDGIRVNAVAPAFVKTPMYEAAIRQLTPEQLAEMEAAYPLGIGSALDVAHAAAFLLGDASAWTTGATLVVDGGFTAK